MGEPSIALPSSCNQPRPPPTGRSTGRTGAGRSAPARRASPFVRRPGIPDTASITTTGAECIGVCELPGQVLAYERLYPKLVSMSRCLYQFVRLVLDATVDMGQVGVAMDGVPPASGTATEAEEGEQR
jgi:hypothetical protein